MDNEWKESNPKSIICGKPLGDASHRPGAAKCQDITEPSGKSKILFKRKTGLFNDG
jgi:hypothetical protein